MRSLQKAPWRNRKTMPLQPGTTIQQQRQIQLRPASPYDTTYRRTTLTRFGAGSITRSRSPATGILGICSPRDYGCLSADKPDLPQAHVDTRFAPVIIVVL